MQRTAPLFSWQHQQKIDAVRAHRADLATRIQRLPKHSHTRIILEAQLQAITADLLRLEHDSDFKEHPHENP